jgi:hypothetical protein
MGPDAAVLESLVPLVGIAASLGMPVAIFFIHKYFKLRNRELDAEIEARRAWTEKERSLFEARVDSLEAALFERGAPATRPLLEGSPESPAPARLPGRGPLQKD